MRKRTMMVIVALSAAMVSGIPAASGDVDHGADRRIVMRDDLVSPSALTMSRNETLEFENDSGQFIRLIFVEPRDQTDKIRCYPNDHTVVGPGGARSTLFEWGPGRRLTATIPPGKAVSACALLPGQYVFVTTRLSRAVRADDWLGTKGTITVQ